MMLVFLLYALQRSHGSSQPGEPPPELLTEPCLIVSHHTALVIQIYAFHYENPKRQW